MVAVSVAATMWVLAAPNYFYNLSMKKILIKKIFYFSLLLIIFSFVLVPVTQASLFENINSGLEEFNTQAGLPKQPGGQVGDIVINIINVVLGFLALVFFVMLLISGFKYLTAAGNKDQAAKALATIRDAVIGILIVIISYALVNFVIVKVIYTIATKPGIGS